METILGIDLGTTNSAVSIIRDKKVLVLEEDGQETIPSVVGLDTNGNVLVGLPALNQWTLAPDRTIRSIKRQMGSEQSIPLGDESYSPQEISAMILRTLKERAARILGHDVAKAVITVPAFFNEQQREATRQAGEIAGLEVVRIINEPTAAALAYETDPDQRQRLLVYDLGGGTFDVSIVQIEQGVVEVLSSHGDTKLGGDDFDELLMNSVCDQFQEEHQLDLRESPASKSRVLKAVEEAKRQLSFEPYVNLEEEFIAEKDGVPLHLKLELSRIDYEMLIEPLLHKTLVCIDESLSDAQVAAPEIDRVILVGGSSRTPLVHRLLQEQLGQPIHSEVDPDLCVSMGAAVQGGLIAGIDLGPVLVDITPHTLGVECRGTIRGFQTSHCFATLIERNTALPASRSEVFYTSSDNQKSVLVKVFQGEQEDSRLNEFVGELPLDGLEEIDQGNEILIRFNLDLDGILTVTAKEKSTGLEETVTVDSAMSRFRSSNQAAARARVEAVLGDAAPSDATTVLGEGSSETAPPDDQDLADAALPKELRGIVANVRLLLVQAEKIASNSNSQDAEEVRGLISQIESAIDRQSVDDITDVSAKLEDLVFYMEDAT